jgi:hypothetical protein
MPNPFNQSDHEDAARERMDEQHGQYGALDASCIADRIAQLNGVFDVHQFGEFTRWFRRASRNVHRWGSKTTLDAVFAVEGVLSDYFFDGLAETSLKAELAGAVYPFAVAERGGAAGPFYNRAGTPTSGTPPRSED